MLDLTGRFSEQAKVFIEAIEQQPSVVFVDGPLGIGKTRLLQYFRELAQQQGISVDNMAWCDHRHTNTAMAFQEMSRGLRTWRGHCKKILEQHDQSHELDVRAISNAFCADLPKRQQFVFFFDDSDRSGTFLDGWLPILINQCDVHRVTWVVAKWSFSEDWQSLSSKIAKHWCSLSEFTRKDAIRYLDKHARTSAMSITQDEQQETIEHLRKVRRQLYSLLEEEAMNNQDEYLPLLVKALVNRKDISQYLYSKLARWIGNEERAKTLQAFAVSRILTEETVDGLTRYGVIERERAWHDWRWLYREQNHSLYDSEAHRLVDPWRRVLAYKLRTSHTIAYRRTHQALYQWRLGPNGLGILKPEHSTANLSDSSVIRQLIQDAFTAETLRRFLQDRPEFKDILVHIRSNPSLVHMTDVVIEQCQTQDLLPQLLKEIREFNPRRYQRYQARFQTNGNRSYPRLLDAAEVFDRCRVPRDWRSFLEGYYHLLCHDPARHLLLGLDVALLYVFSLAERQRVYDIAEIIHVVAQEDPELWETWPFSTIDQVHGDNEGWSNRPFPVWGESLETLASSLDEPHGLDGEPDWSEVNRALEYFCNLPDLHPKARRQVLDLKEYLQESEEENEPDQNAE